MSQSTFTPACSTTLGNFPLGNIYFSPVIPGQALQSYYYAHLGPDCYMRIRKSDNAPFHLNELIGYTHVAGAGNNEVGLAMPANSNTYDFYASLFCSECENECQEYQPNANFNAIREGLVNRWLPYKTWVFNKERESDANLIARNSGTYNYMHYDLPFEPNQNGTWNSNLYSNNKWKNSSKSTKVNKQSTEIEVVDALEIPSTSMDGYNGEVTVGVFKNANYHDTYFSSFEDLQYWTGRGNEACRSSKWTIEADPGTSIQYQISRTISHTGKRSIFWLIIIVRCISLAEPPLQI
ncbi:MAG: hypothetical protein IPK10_05435 [Bacteroidetes bacterium]|nr:hypothetical protein [Bacteroidota bacterium]